MNEVKEQKDGDVGRTSAPKLRRTTPYWLQAVGVAAALVLSALAVWGASGYTRQAPPTPASPPGLTMAESTITLTAAAPQWHMLKLGTAVPAAAQWTDGVPARVHIDETRASKVGTPLGGRVVEIFAELGHTVRKGDPLFVVASSEIAGLRAEQEKAELAVVAARATLAREHDLVAAHAAAAKEEIAARQQLREAEIAATLAKEKLTSLNVSATGHKFTALATRDGIVVEKNVLLAQEVAPETSSPLVTIADLSSVWVVADFFEDDALEIHPGTHAQVTSPALPGTTLEGNVENVASMVNPDRHTIPVRVRVSNPARALKPNMYTRVRFMLQPNPDVTEVPDTALVSDGERQYVYIQESPGSFARREVVAGSARHGIIPILSGLPSGTVVVQEGALLLDNQLTLAH
jgi:membrane fusion protein, heavy metal efflux system